MALKLARRGVRAFEDDINQYYRVVKGVDQDSVTLKLPTSGAFTVLDPLGVTLFSVSPTATALGGTLAVDTTLTPPGGLAPNGAWKLKTTGSLDTDWATWENGRSALVRLTDTNAASISGVALLIDYIEGVDGVSVARSGLHVKGFTRPDRGESSGVLVVQSGAGGALTAYHSHRLRPAGFPNLAYGDKGALEVATDDMYFGALIQSGGGFGTAPGNPDPTLTGAITSSATTIPLSSTALWPVPGSAVPYAGLGTISTWPTPLYFQIRSVLSAGPPVTYRYETCSYTGGGAGAPVTGIVRHINGSDAGNGHNSGDVVTWICASNAAWIRLTTPISKGICVFPADGVTFDTRPAFSVAVPTVGQPADASARIVIRMNGDIETGGTISTNGQLNAGNASVTTTLSTLHIVGTGGTPTIAAGTGAGNGAGTTPTLTVVGTDLSGVITITTGTQVPVANAIIATVTFATAFGAAPKAVLLTPFNGAAAALSGASSAYVNGAETTTAHFVVRSQGTPLAISTPYQWQFCVVG